MEITVLKQPYSISFVGNPVFFQIRSDVGGALKVKLEITYYADEIKGTKEITLSFYPYKQNNQFYTEFDIADILEPYCVPLVKRQKINNIWTNCEVRYKVSFPDHPQIVISEKTAILGGISDTIFVELAPGYDNIFTDRFINPNTLFLFSNRSSNKVRINYHISEMCDVWFIRIPGKTYKLTASGYTYVIPDKTGENNHYFDTIPLSAAYNYLAPDDGILYMAVDDEPVFMIQVFPDPLREEKYILEFRNSFGFIERILLTGKMKYTPEFKPGEEYVVNESHVLRKKNRRSSFTQKYKADIGYKRMSDILFLQDLLLSEEVRIYNPISDETLECKVTAEISLSMLQSEPESIPIEIQVLNEEKYISLDYNYRIFDKTFSEQFN